MSIEVREVTEPSDLKRWVRLPYILYRGDPYQVPPLFRDELAYFQEDRNPAFEVAEAVFLLATRDDRDVGRVCANLNSLETEKLGHKRCRFGWFESVDDQQVTDALLDAVKAWAEARGCTEIAGPLGFSDLDPSAVLIEGFEHLPTISGSYNFPYYRTLLETYGLKKDRDYLEYRMKVPDHSPFFEKMRKRLESNENFEVVTCKSRKDLLGRADEIWGLIEEAFEPLYGVMPLTSAQTRFYTSKYFSFLDPDFVKLTYSTSNELSGFFIGIPNLSQGFKRAGGSLIPFGFLHLLKAYRKPETVDFLLAGVRPGAPTGLLTSLTFLNMYDTLRSRGVRVMETNRELATNVSVHRLWSKFEKTWSRRSRIYRLDLAHAEGTP